MTNHFLADAHSEPTGPESVLYHGPHWYACYTRARAEKQVARTLVQRGIDSYLPMVARKRHWKDRQKLVEFPLFPSYVFGRFTLRDVHVVLTTPGVSTIVRQQGLPAPIAEEELENVRRFAWAITQAGIEPDLRPLITEGERVRVIVGPFVGVEGTVIESRGRKRVLVGISAIGQGVEIDIDAGLLKRLSS